MSLPPVVEFYQEIQKAETKEELTILNYEIQKEILSTNITDPLEMMMLNLAIQTRENFLHIRNIKENGNGVMLVVVDKEDFDPEQMQLDQLQEDEISEVRNDNVVSMKDFKRNQ